MSIYLNQLLVGAAVLALLGPPAAHAEASLESTVDQSSSQNRGADGQTATGSALPVDSSPGYTVSQIAVGGSVVSRIMDYYKLELGRSAAPSDPNALVSRRDDYLQAPENSPPYPFTEWPYGAASLMGASRPNAVDSPLMVGLAPTTLGEWMQTAHVQVYGWVDAGANLSTNHVEGGNAPAGYDYNPNRIQMDQTVLYVERVPDTVQKEHVDWGFRVSAIYGVDYRYTVSDGFLSNQLTKSNKNYGLDLPMIYGEVYIPQVAKGLMIRIGRFISIPDIEAQLAPNNYMYSHSMTYTFDNFTNTGVMATLAMTKNLFLQLGVVSGSDTVITNTGENKTNPFPNQIYPGATFRKDPGAKASISSCIRYQTDSARDDLYVCADAINSGVYGYNNLQWYGSTYYHKFTDKFHVAIEVYNLHESDVPNINNQIVQAIDTNGGTPFSNNTFKYNAPDQAQCRNHTSLTCTATVQTELAYWNYQFAPLDNVSLRTEYYNDMQGQRTGVATSYEDLALGVQHWMSPQIEVRPEIAWYYANDAKAFDGNGNRGVPPDRRQAVILSGDAIIHF